MSAQIVRRIRLPADRTSPGAARAAVRAVVDEAALDAVLDEALLLTTELATNGVVHAGTELDLEIVADPVGITVTVMDFRKGPLTDSQWARGDGGMEERGRGLLLVDRLANRWGTLHHRGGKGVWFRLELTNGALVGEAPPPALLSALGTVYSGVRENATLAEVVEGLLARLSDTLGGTGAAVLLDESDGRGPHTVAAVGATAAQLDAPTRIPLRLTRPWRGELVVESTSPYEGPLAELTADRLALLIENDRLRHTDSERRTWLTFLAEASDLLAQSLDVELTLALIPRLVVPRLGDWCAVHELDDEGDLRLAAATHADETQLAELLDTLPVVTPQLVEAMTTDSVLPLAGPLDGYAVALLARGQQIGTLSVGRSPNNWRSTEEIAVVEDVARRAALAIDNARIHAERLNVAQALQRSLLPPQLPKVDGVDFGAEYVPTGVGVEVGGDFYDVVALSERRWLVMLGDVSGKGIQAATVTGLVRDVTRVLVRDGRPLPEVLTRLNETLVERGAGRFCTLCLASIARLDDGQLDVTLHLAGHDQPVLIRADGETSLVGRCGTALGLLPTLKTPQVRVALGAGDTMVIYTDGVTERRRGVELFGVERLRREAAGLAGFSAEVVAARLRAATLSFSTEAPRDDIAIFALRNDG